MKSLCYSKKSPKFMKIKCHQMSDEVNDVLAKILAHIKIVDKLPVCNPEDDPVLNRKEEEAISSFRKAPLPEHLAQRFNKIQD
jgi:hypothetical protein